MVSGVSSSSQRKIKPTHIRNTPADVARRKIEEALSWGDKEVNHEGSIATLALAKKFHIAPQRSDTQCPREPGELKPCDCSKELTMERQVPWNSSSSST